MVLWQTKTRPRAERKRGGDATILSLDFDGAEEQLRIATPPAASATDEYFEKEWARSVFSLALESFRAQMLEAGKETHLRLFERYVLDADDDGGLRRATRRSLRSSISRQPT